MPRQITLPGATPRDYSRAFGGIPVVSNPLEAMRRSIAGDIGSLGSLYNLSTGVSNAAAGGARAQYTANLPYYGTMMNRASQNIVNNLAGIVNPDVINLMGTQAAERGVGFGVDSPGSNAAYLRALGLTSHGLQNLGQEQLTAAIARTPVGPMFNPASMLTTPEQFQDAQTYANTLAAAPVPSAAAAEAERAAKRGMQLGGGTAGGLAGSANMGGRAPAPSTSPGTVVAPSLSTTIPSAGRNFSQQDWYNSLGIGRWDGGIGTGGSTRADLGNLYDQPFAYEAPGVGSLGWSGQDWGDLFGDAAPAAEDVPMDDYDAWVDYWGQP